METFDIKKNDYVFIYGAGELGKQAYIRIKDQYHICGFLNRRMLETGCGFPKVFSVKDGYEMFPSACVIICVHNGKWHFEIAESLSKCGFYRILFLPLDVSYNEVVANRIKSAYNSFLEEDYNSLINIPVYAELKKENYSTCIRENGRYIVTYCPHELLYQDNGIACHQQLVVDQLLRDGFLTEQDLNPMGVPIAAYERYLSVFRFFQTGVKTNDFNKNLYIMRECNNGFNIIEDSFLHEQWEIYELLEREYIKGLDAMRYAPIDVKWNNKGFFTILDGHHRAAFLYLKGVRDLVVRMKKSDYEQWKNEKSKERVSQAIENHRPGMRIFNPYFMEVDVQYSEYGSTISDYLCSYVIKNNLYFDVLIEYGDWNGGLSREVYRTGKAKRVISIADSIHDMELQKALNEMYYMTEDQVCVTMDQNFINNVCETKVGVIIENRRCKNVWEKILKWDIDVSNIFLLAEHDTIAEELECNDNEKYQLIAQKCIGGVQVALIQYEVSDGKSKEK